MHLYLIHENGCTPLLGVRKRRRGAVATAFISQGGVLAADEDKGESFVFVHFRRGKESLSGFKPSEG